MMRPTILNVDDYEPGRHARSQLLRSFGFDVREAKTGSEALSAALADPPSLIILDVNLPDISGFEVCRRLKAAAATATLPVLQTSATYTAPVHTALGLEGGADAYLVEPVDPPVLLATLNALLRMKRAEEEQRSSARQWQGIFEAIADGVALLSADGVVVRCNQAFRELLAAGDRDVLGQPLSRLVGEADGADGDGALAGLPGGGPRAAVERRHGERWLRITVDPVAGAGVTGGAVCTVADVSDRKAVEVERVRLLGREQAARAAAEAANRSKEDFIAMLAHELRNPLAPIRMAMRTLRGAAERDPDVRRATDIVERQSRHLARLLDDLLDAARLAREKIELRPSTTTVQAVVAEAVEATREIIDARRHTVELVLPPAPLSLYADPTRLAQIVGNLLNNAAKYTPPGGRITVRAEAQDGMVELRVRDSGIGIAPENLDRIFELFAQGHRADGRPEGGGLGIGLTLARMLVELHGGTLTAASEGIGHGSEFIVRLPIGVSGPAATPAEDGRQPRSVARRILVIEDEEDTRLVLRRALELEGHEVAAAADGAEGVKQAVRTAPDVVIIDIGLPQLDGYAVARRLRAALGDAVLLVALTGYGRDDDRVRAAEAGFDVHLVKPVDFDNVARLLRDPPRH